MSVTPSTPRTRKKKLRKKSPPVVLTEFWLDEIAVPLPEVKKGAPAVYYPFDHLIVGGSFKARRRMDALRKAIRSFRQAGHAEQVYKVRDLPEGGCRVWRVK